MMSEAEKFAKALEGRLYCLNLNEIAELAGHILTYSNYRLEPKRMNHFLRGVDMNDLMEGFALCQPPPTQNENTSQSQLFLPLHDALDDTSIQSVD